MHYALDCEKIADIVFGSARTVLQLFSPECAFGVRPSV
jgi:hypothetical protein